MRNTNKKGFTIVELVIVVAVIAILAAVLIPTFSGIIAKAQLSADKKAVHEMNTFIAMEQADTFEEALAALEKNKINTENLSPISAGYSFVWNNETKTIDLVETKEDTVDIIESIKNEDITVSTADYLILAINSGSNNINLGADITVDRDLSIESGNVTLSLNGHTFNTVQNPNGRSGVVYIREAASLTVENGTLNVRSLQNYGDLTIKDDVVINAMDITGGGCIKNKTGNVVIEGGTFNVVNYTDWDKSDKGGACAVENAGGTVTIKGGSFNSVTEQYLIANLSGTMTIEGGEFTAFRGVLDCEGGKLIVNDGKFTVTNDAQSGWIAYTEGDGEIVLNGGEYTSVVPSRDFTGNVTGPKAN